MVRKLSHSQADVCLWLAARRVEQPIVNKQCYTMSQKRGLFRAPNWDVTHSVANALITACEKLAITNRIKLVKSSWSKKFKSLDNQYLTMLVNGFKQILHQQKSFETVRDAVRSKLHSAYPARFPKGHVGISVVALAVELFRTARTVASSQLLCTQCQYEEPEISDQLGYVLYANRNLTGSTSRWVQNLYQLQQQKCPECLAEMDQPIFYNKPPCVLVLEYAQTHIRTSHRLKIKLDEDDVELHLRGIVYHGRFHFTSQFISRKGDIWYHDGRETGKTCIYNGSLTSTQESELKKCRNRDLVLALYAWSFYGA